MHGDIFRSKKKTNKTPHQKTQSEDIEMVRKL